MTQDITQLLKSLALAAAANEIQKEPLVYAQVETPPDPDSVTVIAQGDTVVPQPVVKALEKLHAQTVDASQRVDQLTAALTAMSAAKKPLPAAEKIRVGIWFILATGWIPAEVKDFLTPYVSDPSAIGELVTLVVGIANLGWFFFDRVYKRASAILN